MCKSIHKAAAQIICHAKSSLSEYESKISYKSEKVKSNKKVLVRDEIVSYSWPSLKIE